MKLLQLSILAALFITLDADSKYSSCKVEIKVPKDTVYEAFYGEELKINCTVAFCNNSPPRVRWYRVGTIKRLPINFCNARIKTECRILNRSEGISSLVFQKALRNDSGMYQCESRGIDSPEIKVSVHEKPEDKFWRYMYRIIGFAVFLIIMLSICVVSNCECKGKSGNTPRRQPTHDALPVTHIYENDP